jgi:hypothetical protein|tara:strand:+ start:4582 stop:5577 length:996 start_codon:yes stop_codon:yes gene_type:complete
MPTMKSSGDLIASISTDLADNNAGLISAEDIRHNMEDLAYSINRIVASGDTDGEFRFYNNVRVAATGIGAGGAEGKLVMESGIIFPNAPDGKTTLVQVVPYPGEGGIIHDNLIIDQTSHPHTQYYHKTGVNQADNVLTGNVPVGHANWINASGYSDVGFKFVPVQDTLQEIYTSGTLRFGDGSSIPNGKGLAKAWCNFNASGDATDNLPSIRSYHNISGITRLAPGKLKITFNSGVFDNNNYVALATSHGTVATGSKEDMTVNTVGLVLRQGNNGPDDTDNPRTVTYVIRTETGDYADAEICDFVAFGAEPDETLGDVPFKLMDPSYSENA